MRDEIDKKLLQHYQRGFPILARPYEEIGGQLGLPENEVIERFRRLSNEGLISRIGPVLNHSLLGVSSLVALAIPLDMIDSVAEIINSYEEVNHNYLREHYYNLWFVVTARSAQRLDEVIREIEDQSGAAALILPMEKNFHIDLGFKLWQSAQTS